MTYLSKKNIVIVSGGFDPIHSGHISLLIEAKFLNTRENILIVGLNSTEWLIRKKGKNFYDYQERVIILNSIRYVDEIISFDDSDDTACDLLERVRFKYPINKKIFANGGDVIEENCKELNSNIPGIEYVFGVGGEKKNS